MKRHSPLESPAPLVAVNMNLILQTQMCKKLHFILHNLIVNPILSLQPPSSSYQVIRNSVSVIIVIFKVGQGCQGLMEHQALGPSLQPLGLVYGIYRCGHTIPSSSGCSAVPVKPGKSLVSLWNSQLPRPGQRRSSSSQECSRTRRMPSHFHFRALSFFLRLLWATKCNSSMGLGFRKFRTRIRSVLQTTLASGPVTKISLIARGHKKA